MENWIKVREICKKYKDKAVLDNFSCDIKKNSVNFIMGPSGMGKTTLLNILMGIDKPDSGKILGMEGLSISAVFQEDRLCENFSVSSNIRMVHNDLKGKEKAEFIDKVRDLLEKIGMPEVLKSPVKNLSGGMKRRISILRCILKDADVYFFDEALKGLDKSSEMEFMNVILPYIESKTVIWVTHEEKQREYFSNVHMINL